MESRQSLQLKRVRQQMSIQRRKRSQQKLVTEKRKKFLDMSDLLKQTSMIEDQTHLLLQSYTKTQLLKKLNTDMSIQFWCFISQILDKEIKVKGANIFVSVWRQVCDLQKALEIAEQFLTTEPVVPLSQSGNFRDILSECLLRKIDLGHYRIVLKCVNSIANREQVFKGELNIFIEYLAAYQTDYYCALNTITIISSIINIIDEDSEELLIAIRNFVAIIANLIRVSDDHLLQTILYSLTSTILHGSSIVEILISSEFLSQSIIVFEQSNVKIKNLLIAIIYNTILVGSKPQIIYLIENHLIDLVNYCIVNGFSMDCMHLCLKMYQKILLFISRVRDEYSEEKFGEILSFVRINNLYETLGGYENSNDEFVRDESRKIKMMIQDILGYKIMDVE